MLHIDLGERVVREFCNTLGDISSIEVPPKMMGRMMTLVLAPGGKRQTHKKETHSAQNENA